MACSRTERASPIIRERELEAASRSLGVARGAFLGYKDSGMAGEPSNDDPECFWQADLEEASRRLAAILEEERADVLTVYDEHGGYGHPDHIQVHRVGVIAAEMAGTPSVFMATQNRDRVQELMSNAAELGVRTTRRRRGPRRRHVRRTGRAHHHSAST